jgi:hypothetical protein
VSNITLPRAVIEQVREALKELDYASEPYVNEIARTTLAALDAALAEPPAKPEPVAWMYVNSEGECEQIEYGTPSIDDDSITLLYAAPPAAALAEPDAKPEPATEKDIDIEFCEITLTSHPIDSRRDFRTGFRAAERFHGIGGSKT